MDSRPGRGLRVRLLCDLADVLPVEGAVHHSTTSGVLSTPGAVPVGGPGYMCAVGERNDHGAPIYHFSFFWDGHHDSPLL